MNLKALAAAGAVFLLGAHGASAQPALSAAEQAAVFKAGGFKLEAGKYTRCEGDPTASHMYGQIELDDLNKDGRPEAWLKEGSTYCYGFTGAAFVLMTKTPGGAWVPLLDEVGVPMTKASRHGGWPDIEVGGPGMGPFPVFRFNGAKYVR